MTGPEQQVDHAIEPRPWPAPVEELLSDAGRSAAAVFGGRGIGLAGEADRWAVGRAAVYRFSDPALTSAQARAGADRLASMVERLGDAAPFQVGPVLGRLDTDTELDRSPASWLVVDGAVGQPGDRPEHHADPDDLVVAIGAGMRAMHDLPLAALDGVGSADQGSDRWSAVIDQCRSSIEAGRVDPLDLPPPYDRYTPARLLELVEESAAAATGPGSRSGGSTPPVCCHGFAAAARFTVDRGRFVGFDRIEGPLVADPHFDLAVVQQSVHHSFGPEAVFRLYEAYGSDPDLVLLDRYVLVSHLLGRSSFQRTADGAPG